MSGDGYAVLANNACGSSISCCSPRHGDRSRHRRRYRFARGLLRRDRDRRRAHDDGALRAADPDPALHRRARHDRFRRRACCRDRRVHDRRAADRHAVDRAERSAGRGVRSRGRRGRGRGSVDVSPRPSRPVHRRSSTRLVPEAQGPSLSDLAERPLHRRRLRTGRDLRSRAVLEARRLHGRRMPARAR